MPDLTDIQHQDLVFGRSFPNFEAGQNQKPVRQNNKFVPSGDKVGSIKYK